MQLCAKLPKGARVEIKCSEAFSFTARVWCPSLPYSDDSLINYFVTGPWIFTWENQALGAKAAPPANQLFRGDGSSTAPSLRHCPRTIKRGEVSFDYSTFSSTSLRCPCLPIFTDYKFQEPKIYLSYQTYQQYQRFHYCNHGSLSLCAQRQRP